MIKRLMEFVAELRRMLFEVRLEREIFGRIFDHLNHDADYGYPFRNDEELKTQIREAGDEAQINLELIEECGNNMPKAYGRAFRHIVYRDLNARMKLYLDIANRRVVPDLSDRQRVARCAT